MSDIESIVSARYSDGAKVCDSALCCPTSYDGSLLEAIPQRVLDVDYGCGDPTKYVCAGERVLDLGSGSGKHCFMISQIVGATGKVIGVDMTDDMLALARGAAPEVAATLGYANVEFRKGLIQDLATDVAGEPLLADASVDVVVSNCVLNLVRPDDKRKLFSEIFRVLAPAGRAVIADIVSDKAVPFEMQKDPELWSGCISGALQEDEFTRAFSNAGFADVETVERTEEPWQVVEGIEFRSVVVRARKTDSGGCC